MSVRIGLVGNSQSVIFFLNYSSEMLEMMVDVRAFHYFVVIVNNILPNVLDDCLI